MNQIIILGNLRPEKLIGARTRVYDFNGIAPTLSATIYKEPNVVLIKNESTSDKTRMCLLKPQ